MTDGSPIHATADNKYGQLTDEREQPPRVSIILPTHDRPVLLDEAVASVSDQTFPDWELIIVDDASSPPACSGLPDLQAVRMKSIVNLKAIGGAASKSVGAAKARGDIIAFLDDDDLYDERYLERAVDILDAHPEIDVLFMGVAWFGKAGVWGAQAYEQSMQRTLAEAQGTEIEPGLIIFDDRLLGALLNRVPMAFQRPVVRRHAYERIGPYRSDCLLWDCEWALRAAMHARCAICLAPLYRQRSDGQGFSSKADKQQAQIESSVDMVLGLLRSENSANDAYRTALLRSAASRNAHHLAYFHAQRGNMRPSLSAWWLSQRLLPTPATWKTPISAALHAAGFLRSNT